MNIDRYATNVFWSDEDGVWIADAPDLKSCSAFGDTPEAALAELRTAMKVWLEAITEAGKPIPRPSWRPPLQAAE